MVALVPLLIVLVITYIQRVSVVDDRNSDRLVAIRDLKVQQLNSWVKERKGDLLVMTGDYEIRGLENIFNKETKSSEDIETIAVARELFLRTLRNSNDYSEVFFIEAKTGLVEISTNQELEGTNKSGNPFFNVPLKTEEIYIRDIYFSENTGNYEMTFSAPVYGMKHHENLIGVLVIRINLEKSLYKLLSNRVGLGKTGETLIVSKDVYALNELRWYDNAPLNLKISAQPAVNAANGETGIAIMRDYRKENVLAAYSYIPTTQWGFVCKQDMYELNASIRKMVWNFVLIFLITAVVVYFVARRLSYLFTKPIVKMAEVAKRIKAGDFNGRNTNYSADELGLLALEFNNMADVTESKIRIQKGVSNIASTLIELHDMEDFGIYLLKELMKISDANMSAFYILNELSVEYEHFTSIGANEKMLKSFSAENPEGEFGNAISSRSIYYLKNIPENTIFTFKSISGEAIPKEVITIPIVVEDVVIALISLVNIDNFSTDIYEILKESWSGINISYSNLIASERTRILAEHLSVINSQLEAQSEELQEQAEELQTSSEELQEQNVELEAQRYQVESANKMKSEFLANMSHELRTPLNSILALSQVLIQQTKTKLSNEENGYLEIVLRNGKRLLAMINDILDISKIEAGKMDIIPEPLSMNTLIHLVRDNMLAIATNKGLQLNLNVQDKLTKVKTDESRLYQVLLNIVSNAVKFTEKGSVDIDLSQDSEQTYVTVKDTGIGISKEVLPHIFDEFQQADGTFSRQYEGTGLGLAIANKIIQILGGNIQVESELGKGSVFTVSIPINWFGHTEHEQESGSGIKIFSRLNPEEMDSANDKLKNAKDTHLLYVEDNEDTIIQVKSVLKKEGYQVDIAKNGKEALDFMLHTIPDGIILDLMMPEMDGFEVLEQMRSVDKTRMIPVLVLTAKDLTRQDLDRLSSNDVHQLIIKGDVDIDGLLLKIKLMLGNEATHHSKVVTPIREQLTSERTQDGLLSTVLIVEDNPDSMTTIKAILGEKFKTIEAIDGKEGLRLAQSHLPDLLLLDMSLPKMNGEEIVAILKGNDTTNRIPIIAVTAQAMKGDKERFLEIGCDGYVSKPIDSKDLKNEIERLLNI